MRHWRMLAVVLASMGMLVGGLAATAAADTRSPDRTQDVSTPAATEMFTPDPLTDSKPMPPSRNVAKVKELQAGGTATAAALGAFHADSFAPRTIPSARLAYRDEIAPRIDPGVHDASGVRMYRMVNSTKLWDHPVGQAQWGLKNVTSYLNTGDSFYLDRAVDNAQRNLDRRVESRGAWWYPYDFDAARCTGRPTMRAPWYSAMAQGQLLSLFVRLYEITGAAKWREAADRTFDSLTLAPEVGAPWGSWVDANGYLWLEEYPEAGAPAGERVLNGHGFATYGVYDYWRITKSQAAAELFVGATTTFRRYLPSDIRLTNWASKYSLGCQHPHMSYHIVHTGQSLRLYEMTSSAALANYASTLRSDYPGWGVRGTVRFAAGSHVGYKFDINGNITGTKGMTLGRASNAPTEKRIRIKGRGIYYLITAGVMYGYLVPESFPARVLLGKTVEQRYVLKRTLAFKPGTYTAYTYDRYGNQIAARVGTLTSTTTAQLTATAVVNGRLSYLASSGYFKGWWMPATSGHSVR